eukprot:IDg2026t1
MFCISVQAWPARGAKPTGRHAKSGPAVYADLVSEVDNNTAYDAASIETPATLLRSATLYRYRASEAQCRRNGNARLVVGHEFSVLMQRAQRSFQRGTRTAASYLVLSRLAALLIHVDPSLGVPLYCSCSGCTTARTGFMAAINCAFSDLTHLFNSSNQLVYVLQCPSIAIRSRSSCRQRAASCAIRNDLRSTTGKGAFVRFSIIQELSSYGD